MQLLLLLLLLCSWSRALSTICCGDWIENQLYCGSFRNHSKYRGGAGVLTSILRIC